MERISKKARDLVNTIESNFGGLLTFHFPSLLKDVKTPQRIAVVKQDVYQDLYCCPPYTASPKNIIFSSFKRTGPVALFTKFNTDFWIVKTESDQECNIWQEKWFDCHQQPIEYYLDLKKKPYLNGARGHKVPQGNYSVSVEDIDWKQYDIVISLDISVPARLTRMYPSTTWCYYISEPCMHSYRDSQKLPITGYDLFLNQKYRLLRWLPKLEPHEVEFPYFLQYYGCFHDLLGVDNVFTKRDGIFLESHTAQELKTSQIRELEAFGPIRVATGKTSDIIHALMGSKYFVRLGGRKLWGNAMVEAIAVGCLAFGNPDEFKHASLFTPRSQVRSLEDTLERLGKFESDPNLYERELRRQRNLLDYLCCTRPLQDLSSKIKSISDLCQTPKKYI